MHYWNKLDEISSWVYLYKSNRLNFVIKFAQYAERARIVVISFNCIKRLRGTNDIIHFRPANIVEHYDSEIISRRFSTRVYGELGIIALDTFVVPPPWVIKLSRIQTEPDQRIGSTGRFKFTNSKQSEVCGKIVYIYFATFGAKRSNLDKKKRWFQFANLIFRVLKNSKILTNYITAAV